MPFQPLNDDHAIFAAAFGITLDKPLSAAAVNSLVKSPLDWRKELPAIELSQSVDFQINPQTGQPVNRLTRGVDFSHKRPDGSASWQLEVMGPEIRVSTTLYTRWDPTWAKAGDILIGVTGQLVQEEKERGIGVQSVALLVTDVFSTDDDQPDYSELFVTDGNEIPARILRRGRLWHSHTGWFADRPGGRVLNQVNVDARTGTDGNSIRGLRDDQTRVVVQHNQIFRPSGPLPFDEKEIEDCLLREVPLMHIANKSILKEILTPAMQDRIKVNT